MLCQSQHLKMTWSPIGVWPLKCLKVDVPPKDESIQVFVSLENGVPPDKFSELLPQLLGCGSLVPRVLNTRLIYLIEFNIYFVSQPSCVCFDRILEKFRLTSLFGSDIRS